MMSQALDLHARQVAAHAASRTVEATTIVEHVGAHRAGSAERLLAVDRTDEPAPGRPSGVATSERIESTVDRDSR